MSDDVKPATDRLIGALRVDALRATPAGIRALIARIDQERLDRDILAADYKQLAEDLRREREHAREAQRLLNNVVAAEDAPRTLALVRWQIRACLDRWTKTRDCRDE